MAIFNRAFLNEAVEWHGKYFLTDKELHDPKFRKAQYDKVYAFVKDIYESEEFKKNQKLLLSLLLTTKTKHQQSQIMFY